MKVHIAKYDPSRVGGGWTFSRNLDAGLGSYNYEGSDVYLIPSPSMVGRHEVEQAKRDGKKIVLRIDNHLLPSRNRNTGMSKMKDFADVANLIVYQSQWAKDYLDPIVEPPAKTPRVVILNGVNLGVFKPILKNERALYVRSSRIEEKGWELARFWYSQNPNNNGLDIVGKFSQENLSNNFDFINNEVYRFWGEQPTEVMANLMGASRQFLYSYFMDACSNTLLEARASGCEIVDVYGMLQTGGAPEIMACDDISLERMCVEYQAAMEKL